MSVKDPLPSVPIFSGRICTVGTPGESNVWHLFGTCCELSVARPRFRPFGCARYLWCRQVCISVSLSLSLSRLLARSLSLSLCLSTYLSVGARHTDEHIKTKHRQQIVKLASSKATCNNLLKFKIQFACCTVNKPQLNSTSSQHRQPSGMKKVCIFLWHRQTDRQMDEQTDRRRQTDEDKQTDKQIDRQSQTDGHGRGETARNKISNTEASPRTSRHAAALVH